MEVEDSNHVAGDILLKKSKIMTRKNGKKGQDEADVGLTRNIYSDFKIKDKCDEVLMNPHQSHRENGGDGIETEILAESEQMLEQRMNNSIIDNGYKPNDDYDGRDSPDLASLNRKVVGGKLGSKSSIAIKTWPPKYGWTELTFAVIAVVLYIADIGLDIKLMFTYHTPPTMHLFWLTLGFIAVPSFISGVVSIVWTYMDAKEKSKSSYSKVVMVFRIIFTFFQLGRAFRYLEFLYYIYKCWKMDSEHKRKEISLKAIEQKRDAVILGLVDGFLESALQLMLQLSLTIILNLEMDVLRVLSLLTSWLSTSLTLTSYYRTIRKANKDTYNVNYKASTIYYLWRVFELGPRFLLLALGVTFLRPWVYIGVGIHFILALIMHIAINPKLEGVCLSWMKIPFLILISFISIFCFINLKKGQTFRRVLMYYFLYYIENIIIMALILCLTPSNNCLTSQQWHCAAYSLVPGIFLHILFQTLYYCVCHPHLDAVKCSMKNCCVKQ